MSEIIHRLPFDEYLRNGAVSISALKHFARSPAHYRHALATPSKSTPAQALGTHVHGLILEPETYRYAVAPTVDRRTKDGKLEWSSFLAESEGANVVTEDQHHLALAMREAVLAQPYARALLEDGEPEVTLRWSADGIDRKGRVDWVCSAHDAIVDLKTAQDASPDDFARAAGSYKYHWQDAWYRQGAEACGLGKRPMVFIVVENEAPFAVALYTLDEEAIYSATYRIERLIEQYAECQASGVFPGYPVEVQSLSIPKWSL